MSNKSTMVIRAPKNIVYQIRMNFPNLKDPEWFKVMYDSSLLKMEGWLRAKNKK